MPNRTLQKHIRAEFSTIIKVNYCKLQHLLSCENPIAYTTNAYGWAADVYDVGNGVAIVTGYSPFGRIQPDYDICKKYEALASKIMYSRDSYDTIRDKLRDLINEFINEVTK